MKILLTGKDGQVEFNLQRAAYVCTGDKASVYLETDVIAPQSVTLPDWQVGVRHILQQIF
ncbi:hypothetical protein MXC99_00895 [Thauera aromatica]|uniref:hypothetical protein n=1 Tax=Thauera aromatica TaxID=59405 RepID=UPI001FFC401F|nr:hypothetical protein [Thauera aromatica]MCK2086751.1 hypothetical protein [Thauera aromatica]